MYIDPSYGTIDIQILHIFKGKDQSISVYKYNDISFDLSYSSTYSINDLSFSIIDQPNFGTIDISPIVVYFGLWFIKSLLFEYWPR